jgi:hypothetical protein
VFRGMIEKLAQGNQSHDSLLEFRFFTRCYC